MEKGNCIRRTHIRPSIRWARAGKHVAIEETCTRRIIQGSEANSFYDIQMQAGVSGFVHTGVEKKFLIMVNISTSSIKTLRK